MDELIFYADLLDFPAVAVTGGKVTKSTIEITCALRSGLSYTCREVDCEIGLPHQSTLPDKVLFLGCFRILILFFEAEQTIA